MSRSAANAGTVALALISLLVAPTVAFAQREEIISRPADQTAPFWRQVRRPGSRRVQALMRQAMQFRAEAQMALSAGPRPHRYVAALRSAEIRLRRAVELVPDDPVPLYEWGSVRLELTTNTSLGPPSDDPAERDARHAARREVLRTFARLRREHPEFRPQDVAFQLAYLHHGLDELEEAVDEYLRGIALAETDAEATTSEGNLAEILMLAGRLEESVVHYERAIAGAQRGRNPFSEGLAWFGLALARDRLGEHARAIEAAARAMSITQGLPDVLRAPGVSFEPLRELHWYDALRHLARAEEAAHARERQRALLAARRTFRAYLADAPPDDRFRGVAETHVERIGRWLASGSSPY